MNKTLLEYANDILNDMDSDPVNSISDTYESEQVAQIVRSTYEAMMSNRNWPHMRRSLQLTSSGDPAYPTHMSIESGVKELLFINYNGAGVSETRRKYSKVKWREPDEFIRLTNNRNSDSPNVDIIQDYTGVELLITNNNPPTFYTSFDDDNLVFDSYDLVVDTTLQTSKVQSQGYVFPTWTHSDAFIPDIPQEAEAALLEESKAKAMFKLKQMVDSKAEQESGRQQRWLARKAWRVKGGVRYQDYGRKGRK